MFDVDKLPVKADWILVINWLYSQYIIEKKIPKTIGLQKKEYIFVSECLFTLQNIIYQFNENIDQGVVLIKLLFWGIKL